MTISIPDDILSSAGLSEEEVRIELAVLLFSQDRITMGQACRIAGVDQLTFQLRLARMRIPIHYGVSELEQDLTSIRGHQSP